MTNAELIKALRYCAEHEGCDYYIAKDCPRESTWMCGVDCDQILMLDTAAALKAADKRTADLEAQLQKEGEWIYEDLDNFRKYKVTCPHCGAWYIGNYDAYDEPSDFNYCPHCGNICNPANLAWEKELSERERKEQNDGET